ncbi:MAG TPA: glycosyltransferase [Holophagaceae bacterium]|nr:glycosyltransferase [Holophagaceae bacterium]
MRILLTNRVLEGRTGTETHLRDLALGLKARGHEVAVAAPRLGELARALAAEGIPGVADPFDLPWTPDLIHGHHAEETLTALAACPGVPGLFVVHDAGAWHDAPPRHPRLLRYYAVDEACADRIREAGLPVAGLLPNAVDLARFRPRGPLPAQPRRALVFSNYAKPGNHLKVIRAACRAAGLPLDVVGEGVGRFAEAPEALLGDYDLVFGKARCALEAMATGCAVILCDFAGFGGLVTSERVAALRPLNFGRRALAAPIEGPALLAAIRAYEAADAARVAAWAREEASLERLLDRVEAAHKELREAAAAQPTPDPRAEARALVTQLQAQARAAGARRDRELLRQLGQLRKTLWAGGLVAVGLALALALDAAPWLALAGGLGLAFVGSRVVRRFHRLRPKG